MKRLPRAPLSQDTVFADGRKEQVIDYAYEDDRLVDVRFDGESQVELVYDTRGLLTGLTTELEKTSLTYDSEDRLSQLVRLVGSEKKRTTDQYRYDTDGHLLEHILQTSYTPTDDSGPSEIEIERHAWEYDPLGRLVVWSEQEDGGRSSRRVLRYEGEPGPSALHGEMISEPQHQTVDEVYTYESGRLSTVEIVLGWTSSEGDAFQREARRLEYDLEGRLFELRTTVLADADANTPEWGIVWRYDYGRWPDEVKIERFDVDENGAETWVQTDTVIFHPTARAQFWYGPWNVEVQRPAPLEEALDEHTYFLNLRLP